MRYWDRLRDPDKAEPRSRSVVEAPLGSAPAQFGQRPMFSVPGPAQPPPAEDRMGPGARLDGVTPVDKSAGSKHREDLITVEPLVPVVLARSNDNVANPPTNVQLVAAFGHKPIGTLAFVIDGGGAGIVWLCIKSTNDTWWYEQMTKAV